MEFFWFWVLVLLLIVTVFAWPSWPHTRVWWPHRWGGRWPYFTSFLALVAILVILFLGWFGYVLISLPAY